MSVMLRWWSEWREEEGGAAAQSVSADLGLLLARHGWLLGCLLLLLLLAPTEHRHGVHWLPLPELEEPAG